MKLYLIKHGQSVANKEKRHGAFNDPLTEEGINQAKSVKAPDCDLVYASDMIGALRTAKIIFHDKEIILDSRLREKNCGIYSGLKIAECDYSNINKMDFMKRKVLGGESLIDVQKRELAFVSELPEGSHAIVAHGTLLRVLVASLQKKDIKKYILENQMDNCDVITI